MTTGDTPQRLAFRIDDGLVDLVSKASKRHANFTRAALIRAALRHGLRAILADATVLLEPVEEAG